MSLDIDILIETYRVCKEYIPQKDRQAAADHLIGAIADYDLSEEDFRMFAGTDSYLKRAVEETMGEEFETAHDDDDEDQFNSW